MRPLRILRLRLRALFRREVIEQELSDELQFHIEMQTEANLRAGMPAAEARRQAVLLFGGVEGHKEESRQAQGLGLMGLSASWLDFKLALRLLRKYPGLSIVAGVALTVAFGLAAAWFEVMNDFVNPTLPLVDGDRIVAIRNWDAAAAAPELQGIHDFQAWREEVRSVADLGAFVQREENLVTKDGWSEPIGLTEITASAFRVTRVAPLLGRPLVETDEQPGAPWVAVIGYDLWQARFAGDPDVVGESVRLGNTPATIVGVMPEGFAFPFNESLWIPLRIDAVAAQHERGEGPPIRTFGRLAAGATVEEAQAELTIIGLRAAADFPKTHAHLRPQVLPYVDSFIEGAWVLHVGNIAFLMILIVVCANVGALTYARTATRLGEITVRTALGAPRSRILAQLSAESVVLTLLAAIVALVIVRAGIGWGMDIAVAVEGEALPFWWQAGIAPRTVVCVTVVAVFAGLLIGVPQALWATSGPVQPGLQRLTVGAGGIRFGGIWTAVIILQIALSVAFLPQAISEGRQLLGSGITASSFPADQYLSARIETAPASLAGVEGGDERSHTVEVYEELKRRLEAEPEVAGATFASRLPVMNFPSVPIEVQGMETAEADATSKLSRIASVDDDFFSVLDIPIRAGRMFEQRDVEFGRSMALVSESFVRRFFGVANPIGQHIRPIVRQGGEPAPWLEIIGVAADVPVTTDASDEPVVLYRPARPGSLGATHLAVRVADKPETFASRLRAIARDTDPALRLYDVRSLDEADDAERRMYKFFTLVFSLIGMAAVLLSIAGIYSLVSFTVAQRRREIGIRAALGAQPRRIVTTIFSRAVVQLTLGVLAGCLLAALLGDQGVEEGPIVLMSVAALLMLAGLLACVLPAWRAVHVQPTESIKVVG